MSGNDAFGVFRLNGALRMHQAVLRILLETIDSGQSLEDAALKIAALDAKDIANAP